MRLNFSGSTSVLILLGAFLVVGAKQATTAPSSTLTIVDRLSQAFDDAQFHKDQGTLRRLLAPEMIYISGSGRLAGREAFLAAFNDPSEHYEPFVITDRRLVQLGDDVVAVTADGTIRGTNASGKLEERFRYTDVFRERMGKWQVAFVQVSRKTG